MPCFSVVAREAHQVQGSGQEPIPFTFWQTRFPCFPWFSWVCQVQDHHPTSPGNNIHHKSLDEYQNTEATTDANSTHNLQSSPGSKEHSAHQQCPQAEGCRADDCGSKSGNHHPHWLPGATGHGAKCHSGCPARAPTPGRRRQPDADHERPTTQGPRGYASADHISRYELVCRQLATYLHEVNDSMDDEGLINWVR